MRLNRAIVTLINFVLAIFPFVMIPLTAVAVYDYLVTELFSSELATGWFDFMDIGIASGVLFFTTMAVLIWGATQKT